MRAENDIVDAIRAWAGADDKIRTVILTSSRADPARTPDALSDYDVELYVRNTAPFAADAVWVTWYGSVAVRWPLVPGPTGPDPAWITQLVQYDDGVRIDYQVTAQPPQAHADHDHGYRVIVDKDGAAGRLAPPSHTHYVVRPPSAEAFTERLNAFWWDVLYVPKALRRGELLLARHMLEVSIRPRKLLPLLRWRAGVAHGWSIDPGIYGRWLHRYLEAPTWTAYQETFAGPTIDDHWAALDATTDLASRLGRDVGHALGYLYPETTERKVMALIERIRTIDLEGAA